MTNLEMIISSNNSDKEEILKDIEVSEEEENKEQTIKYEQSKGKQLIKEKQNTKERHTIINKEKELQIKKLLFSINEKDKLLMDMTLLTRSLKEEINRLQSIIDKDSCILSVKPNR